MVVAVCAGPLKFPPYDRIASWLVAHAVGIIQKRASLFVTDLQQVFAANLVIGALFQPRQAHQRRFLLLIFCVNWSIREKSSVTVLRVKCNCTYEPGKITCFHYLICYTTLRSSIRTGP